MTGGAKVLLGAAAVGAGLLVFGAMRRDDDEVEFDDDTPVASNEAVELAGQASSLANRLWEISRQLREQGR